MFLIVAGNVIDGLSFHGPFKSAEDANAWADIALHGEDWNCAPLFMPESK